MNNSIVAGIYIPFFLISVVIFIAELYKSYRNRQNFMLALMSLCVTGWIICEILTLFLENAPSTSFLWNIGLIFVGFTSPCFFVFTLRFYRSSHKLSSGTMLAIFTIPIINIIMVLTSGYHTLIREINIITILPVRDIISAWGPWFWVHTSYCYLLAVVIVVFIMTGHYHMPKFYRLSSTMMVFGITLTMSGNFVTLLGLMPTNFDPTIVAMSIAILFIHLALISNEQSIFVRLSRGQVFRYLEEYILVLGDDDRIADYNSGAADLFSSMGIDLNSCALKDIMDTLLQKGAVLKKIPENKTGIDIHVMNGDFPLALNLRIHDMSDEKNHKIGSIAIFTDVTENRALIERLDAKVGVDPLTGIANRMAYEGAKKRFDSAEHLPLSVIICDLNNLKEVNDTFGHQYGDKMLQVLADTLEAVCPKSCFVARIGGDEFIFLLSRTDQKEASALMEIIRNKLLEIQDLPFNISVALGAATRCSAEESVDDAVTSADSCMYENKKQIKADSHSSAYLKK